MREQGGSNGLDRFRAPNSYQMLERRANTGVTQVTPVRYWDIGRDIPNRHVQPSVDYAERSGPVSHQRTGGPRPDSGQGRDAADAARRACDTRL